MDVVTHSDEDLVRNFTCDGRRSDRQVKGNESMNLGGTSKIVRRELSHSEVHAPACTRPQGEGEHYPRSHDSPTHQPDDHTHTCHQTSRPLIRLPESSPAPRMHEQVVVLDRGLGG